MGKSFHAYPSRVLSYLPYDRRIPLACDTLEWDTTGLFDIRNHCFVPDVWQAPPLGAQIATLFFRGVLPTVIGATDGEDEGNDINAYQSGSQNIGDFASRTMKLAAGEKVWCVPCIACGGTLTNALGGASGFNTVNWFEGEILECLGP